jgi:uncharacterized membrane protein YfcA
MKTNSRLWTAQAVLAALFLFAGVFKLITPTAALEAQSHMSGVFIKFIGVCETLGAIGLIVPWLTKIRSELTPFAAAGLVIIMIGAVTVSLIQGAGVASAFPGVVGAVAFYVARGRWPKAVRPSRAVLEPTVLRRAA